MAENQPTLEDLQKQVLDLQKELEAQKTQHDADAKKLSETEEDLKKARGLNADLMSKVPAGDGTGIKKQDDPYADMSDEEFLDSAIQKIVEDAAAKNKGVTNNGNRN